MRRLAALGRIDALRIAMLVCGPIAAERGGEVVQPTGSPLEPMEIDPSLGMAYEPVEPPSMDRVFRRADRHAYRPESPADRRRRVLGRP